MQTIYFPIDFTIGIKTVSSSSFSISLYPPVQIFKIFTFGLCADKIRVSAGLRWTWPPLVGMEAAC